MEQRSRFLFDGQEYAVERAEIVAALSDPYWCDTYNFGRGKSLGWAVELRAQERKIDGHLQSPNVGIDELNFLTIPNWHSLVGVHVRWSEPINAETDERYGMTCDGYEHELITKGELRITDRKETVFRVIASGENEAGQTFMIDVPARFVGIYVHGSGRDSAETIRDRLSLQISTENLRAGATEFRHEYQSGVKMCTAFYTPLG